MKIFAVAPSSGRSPPLGQQGAPRRTDVRPAVVRPRRPIWLGNFPKGSGVYVRAGHFGTVQPHQRPIARVEGSSAGHGREST